ncbi:selenocysteine-specific translation elongation factor [Desulfoplanes sp.]
MPVIMGTAGHIDHGKTTLTKALTGTNCDRLVEEKKRGITIELGFAFLDLDSDLRLGIIDVPGHEKFVKNMVAGAAGIDFALLVIAADEGVMPQTREHLEICALLGIKTGLVALTKTDMVDEEWLELVTEDVQSYLETTFLKDAPIIPVSAHTGAGLGTLKGEIGRLTREFKPKRRSDLFRLPVDRVFVMKGYGTVVTGTSFSGRLKVGQDLVLYPSGVTTRVRGLQVHGDAQDETLAGLRTAINLYGLEKSEINRGEFLAPPDTLFPSRVWDLEITCLSSARKGIKHRTQVHFHHGTKEVLARLYFLDRDILEPGETTVCQVRFEAPMAGVYGDRCIIRSFSPLQTIAGASIINPLGRKVKRFSKDLKILETLATSEDNDLVIHQLELAGTQGLSFAKLRIMTDIESKGLEKILQTLGGRQQAFLVDKEQRIYVSGELILGLCDQAVEHFKTFHRHNPMRPGISRGELASTWGKDFSQKLFHFILERLNKQERIVVEQELLHLPGHKVSLASDQSKLRKELTALYEKGGLTPPTLKVVSETLEVTPKDILPLMRHLVEEKRLIKISEDLYFDTKAIGGLKTILSDFFATKDELTPADFKELTGLSRKFAIPLLEFMDKQKFTVRIGNSRKMRGK